MRAGKKFSLLVGIAIDSVIQEIGADAAIVEQGVAFARCAVAGDLLAFALHADQKLQQLALGFLHLFGEIGVGAPSRQSRRRFHAVLVL